MNSHANFSLFWEVGSEGWRVSVCLHMYRKILCYLGYPLVPLNFVLQSPSNPQKLDLISSILLRTWIAFDWGWLSSHTLAYLCHLCAQLLMKVLLLCHLFLWPATSFSFFFLPAQPSRTPRLPLVQLCTWMHLFTHSSKLLTVKFCGHSLSSCVLPWCSLLAPPHGWW